MYIEFRDNKLLKYFESEKERKVVLGDRAKRYVKRINTLKALSSTAELYKEHRNLNPHKYKDGSGRISIKLTGNWRILFWEKEDGKGNNYLLIDSVVDPHGNEV